MRCPHCKAELPRLLPQTPWPVRQRARITMRLHQAAACLPHSEGTDPWAALHETQERVSAR